MNKHKHTQDVHNITNDSQQACNRRRKWLKYKFLHDPNNLSIIHPYQYPLQVLLSLGFSNRAKKKNRLNSTQIQHVKPILEPFQKILLKTQPWKFYHTTSKQSWNYVCETHSSTVLDQGKKRIQGRVKPRGPQQASASAGTKLIITYNRLTDCKI